MRPTFTKAKLSEDVLDRAIELLQLYKLEGVYLSDNETGPSFIDGSLLV